MQISSKVEPAHHGREQNQKVAWIKNCFCEPSRALGTYISGQCCPARRATSKSRGPQTLSLRQRAKPRPRRLLSRPIASNMLCCRTFELECAFTLKSCVNQPLKPSIMPRQRRTLEGTLYSPKNARMKAGLI